MKARKRAADERSRLQPGLAAPLTTPASLLVPPTERRELQPLLQHPEDARSIRATAPRPTPPRAHAFPRGALPAPVRLRESAPPSPPIRALPNTTTSSCPRMP